MTDSPLVPIEVVRTPAGPEHRCPVHGVIGIMQSFGLGDDPGNKYCWLCLVEHLKRVKAGEVQRNAAVAG